MKNTACVMRIQYYVQMFASQMLIFCCKMQYQKTSGIRLTKRSPNFKAHRIALTL